ncbi:hypothetical protein BDY17DRAFT_301797 [Neohortaea acidophila]|uniref:Uncharacterized protein n=1 Tax=Neohortaea acidophila TaxID=245834 RepID=A0A6A6PK67_9PEZI|nr:uncharacterized protein BDY17DRAFT_301797 [Neohortaea acidophila]KAF2480450.1 hypothetical protein BDY17DRAFT_301797 [Neohortaea acidophila]
MTSSTPSANLILLTHTQNHFAFRHVPSLSSAYKRYIHWQWPPTLFPPPTHSSLRPRYRSSTQTSWAALVHLPSKTIRQPLSPKDQSHPPMEPTRVNQPSTFSQCLPFHSSPFHHSLNSTAATTFLRSPSATSAACACDHAATDITANIPFPSTRSRHRRVSAADAE